MPKIVYEVLILGMWPYLNEAGEEPEPFPYEFIPYLRKYGDIRQVRPGLESGTITHENLALAVREALANSVSFYYGAEWLRRHGIEVSEEEFDFFDEWRFLLKNID